MFTIEGNTITSTRGDTIRVKVSVVVDDEEYTPAEGDTIRFALKHRTMNADKTEYSDAEPLINKTIPNDTLILHIEPNDTKSLGFGKYDYDVEITFADGDVHTFISDTLTLAKEVH